VFRATCSMIHA